MELLSMGPGRRNDHALLQNADGTDAEPVDLGMRSRPAALGAESPDLDERSRDEDASWEEPGALHEDHWLAGLARPEVLGVSGAALLLLIAIGMPFLTAFETIRVYVAPNEINAAWRFGPTFVAAGMAAALGLGGLRQAAYHGAAAWARVTSGVSATVGLLVAVGTAVVWFATTQSDPFDQLRP